MKKAFIKKQAKPNGKGAKGKGFNSGKNKSNPKNNESKKHNDKNDYEI